MKEEAAGILITVAPNASTLDCLMTFAYSMNHISELVPKLDTESTNGDVLSDCSEGFNIICDKINQMLSKMETLTYDSTSRKTAIEILNKMKTVANQLGTIKTSLIDKINKVSNVVEGKKEEAPKAEAAEKTLEDLINGIESKPELSTLPTVSNKPTLEANNKDLILNNNKAA